MGTQSAVRTTRLTSGSSVHSPSASGTTFAGESHPAPASAEPTFTMRVPWTWRAPVQEDGAPPTAHSARVRLRRTTPASSPEEYERLSEAKGGSLVPPCRVVNAARMPDRARPGTVRYAPGLAPGS